jgi:hypothetical protein
MNFTEDYSYESAHDSKSCENARKHEKREEDYRRQKWVEILANFSYWI